MPGAPFPLFAGSKTDGIGIRWRANSVKVRGIFPPNTRVIVVLLSSPDGQLSQLGGRQDPSRVGENGKTSFGNKIKC